MLKLPNNCRYLIMRKWSRFCIPCFNNPWNKHYQMYKLDSKEAAHIGNHFWIMEKATVLQIHLFIDYSKASLYCRYNKLPIALKKMGVPGHLICLLKSSTMNTKQQNARWSNQMVVIWEISVPRQYTVSLSSYMQEKSWIRRNRNWEITTTWKTYWWYFFDGYKQGEHNEPLIEGERRETSSSAAILINTEQN